MPQPRLARVVGHRQIALRDALGCVDQDQRDVRPLGCLQRPQLAVVLDPLPVLALAADAGRVDQPDSAVAPLDHRVDRVAGRPRLIGDDHPRTAQDRVQQRRLADVRTAQDRDAELVTQPLIVAGALDRVQPLDHRVQQVSGAASVHGRHRHRVAQSQPVQLQRIRLVSEVVDLVGDQQHGRARAAQDLRDLLVTRHQTGPGVDHQQHQVGLLHRHPRLRRHFGLHRRVVCDVEPAGVDQPERVAAPLAQRLGAVSGDAGHLMHHRPPRRGQPVDQRRLPGIGEADDGDRPRQHLRLAARR